MFAVFPRFSEEGTDLAAEPFVEALVDLSSVLGVAGGACAFLADFSDGVPVPPSGTAELRSRRDPPLLPRGNLLDLIFFKTALPDGNEYITWNEIEKNKGEK